MNIDEAFSVGRYDLKWLYIDFKFPRKVKYPVIKMSLPCFLQILKLCLLNTCLAEFSALIFIQRPFTLSVTFGFHGLPLLTFKTDRLQGHPTTI